MALLLQINNQHCYILTKKSPDFTVGFTFMLYVLWIFSNAEWHVSTTITSHRISFITPKSQCSHYSSLSLLPHLATTGLFTLSIFSGPQHCIIYIFLMTYDVEYLFICLLIICMSSLVRCLFRYFFHFIMGLSYCWILQVLWVYI